VERKRYACNDQKQITYIKVKPDHEKESTSDLFCYKLVVYHLMCSRDVNKCVLIRTLQFFLATQYFRAIHEMEHYIILHITFLRYAAEKIYRHSKPTNVSHSKEALITYCLAVWNSVREMKCSFAVCRQVMV
jgi:hypothetical protein